MRELMIMNQSCQLAQVVNPAKMQKMQKTVETLYRTYQMLGGKMPQMGGGDQ